jgi:hypothetical protein
MVNDVGFPIIFRRSPYSYGCAESVIVLHFPVAKCSRNRESIGHGVCFIFWGHPFSKSMDSWQKNGGAVLNLGCRTRFKSNIHGFVLKLKVLGRISGLGFCFLLVSPRVRRTKNGPFAVVGGDLRKRVDLGLPLRGSNDQLQGSKLSQSWDFNWSIYRQFLRNENFVDTGLGLVAPKNKGINHWGISPFFRDALKLMTV